MFYKKIQAPKAILLASIWAVVGLLGVGVGEVSADTILDVSSGKQGDYFMGGGGHTDFYHDIYDTTDFLILQIRLDSPYCNNASYRATLDGLNMTKKCGSATSKYSWFYIDTRGLVDLGESESLLVRVNHPSSPGNGEIYYIDIGSMSSFEGVVASVNSATQNTITRNISDPDYHVLLMVGDVGNPANVVSVIGGDLWPDQEDSLADGMIIIGSSTPATNNTLGVKYSVGAENGLALFDFVGYYSIGSDFPEFAIDLSLSWPDPIFCTYSYDCTADFVYSNMNIEDATTTITWNIDNDGTPLVATSTLNLAYPFQNFSLSIASTTGDRIGDVDTFSVEIGDYWEGAGRIIWVEELYPTSFLPDCSATSVCDFLAGTSTIFGNFPEVLACGAVRGGCYLLKPGEGTIDLFRRNANQAGSPYRNLGIIQEEIFGLASSTAVASSSFHLDLTAWGGRTFLVAESETMNTILDEELLDKLYLILRSLFYFCFSVSLLIQITLMTRRKEEG